MKIKITENENVKEVEISLGLSSKSKGMLKAFAEKTKNTVVNAGTQVVKKVNDFVDEIVEEETREAREHMAEIVKEAKEDAQRIVDEARERYFASTQNQFDEIDEDEEKFFYYLDSLKLYTCENSDSTQEAKKFIKAFKYPLTPCSIQAYRAALRVSEISFKSIVNKIEILGETPEDIAESLKVEFNIWLKAMPEVRENYPTANLIQLLKYFVKKYRHEKTSNFGEGENEIYDEVENANISEIEKDNAFETEDEIDEPKEDAQEEIDKNDTKVKNNLEEKISKIPEGKIFTLAEYLDYIEEFKCDVLKNEYNIAEEFFDMIKFPCTKITTAVFVQMLKLDKPTYKKIDEEILYGRGGSAIECVKTNFGIWLARRPDVKKYCPKANLWQLLVYFKKKVKEAENN